MMETVDGEYQNCKAFGGAYTREHFFGKYPETAAMVANLSDDDIWRLNRGGHDPHKVYAAYHAAVNTKGQPTVILAKTVKGYGMGSAGEAQNITHQQKKMDDRRDPRVPRPLQHSDFRRQSWPRCRTTTRARTRRRCSTCTSGASALGRSRCRSARKADESLPTPELGALRRLTKAQRRTRDLDHHGLRAGTEPAAARQGRRPARRADRRRRGAHLRHGRHVPPDRHLRAVRPEVQADGRRPAHVLPRRRGRPGAAGRHHRSRAPCARGSRRRPATAPTTCRCCRSSSSTRCSACSASATLPGPPATCARAASCSAPPPAAPR